MQSSSQSKFVGKVRPILKHNDPHLRHVCPPFDWDNPAHMQGLADLLETLIDSQRARGLLGHRPPTAARRRSSPRGVRASSSVGIGTSWTRVSLRDIRVAGRLGLNLELERLLGREVAVDRGLAHLF